MEYKEFKKLIENLQKCRERSHSMYTLGIDLMSYDDIYHEIFGSLLLSVFGVEGKDWIDWYLYERPSFGGKEPLQAFDVDGTEICQNIESLWETVKEYMNEKNN
jgi:hypothetical protein